MTLLVYTPLANAASKQLLNVIVNYVQGETTEIIKTPGNLSNRLRSNIKINETIVVLLITSKKELSFAHSLRNFLEGTKLILILPDRESQTISKGHKLYPRYVSYTDSDFSDVSAVLNKIITNNRYGEGIRWKLLDRMEEEDQEGCLS